MIVASDLDDCQVGYVDALMEFLQEKGLGLEYDDCFNYSLSTILAARGHPLTDKAEDELFQEFHESSHFHNIQPLDGAVKALEELSLWGYSVVDITARDLCLANLTRECVQKFFGDNVQEVHFSYNRRNPCLRPTKGELCRRLRPEILVEDNLENAVACQPYVPKVFLFERPWNKGFAPEGVQIIHRWEQVLEYVGEIATPE